MPRKTIHADFGLVVPGKRYGIILRRFCGEIIDMISENMELSLIIQYLERYRRVV
jgi:hypothetical protein